MDQAAIVLGVEDHLLPILCQPCQPFALVTLPAGLQLWGIDSMVARSTTGVAYETARAAAFIGYKLICQYEGIDVTPEKGSGIPRWTDSRWKGYLSNLAPSEFRSRYERWLPESLDGREFLERAGEHARSVHEGRSGQGVPRSRSGSIRNRREPSRANDAQIARSWNVERIGQLAAAHR